MVDEDATQVRKGTRQQAPVLTTCIFSHLDEFSSVVIMVIQVITIVYRAMHMHMVVMSYFEDGIVLKRGTTEFRMCFKDALMCAGYMCECRWFWAHHFTG